MIVRSAFFHLTDATRFQWFEDAVMVIDRPTGNIASLESWDSWQKRNSGKQDSDFIDLRGHLIVPGFIDAHVHFPQIGVMGAFGEHLLTWLERYIFPEEAKYADDSYARERAQLFWRQLFRHGTTMAAVFSSCHASATQILFEEADRLGACAIIGKTMMDRNVPSEICQTTDQSCGESEELCQQWNKNEHLKYAFTPRFAPACSNELLRRVGKLHQKYDGSYVQSHLSETQEEIAWVKKLFPEAEDYTDVYGRFGLLSSRAIMGHGIWLADSELKRLAAARTTIAHCPVSNQFLGSGAMGLRRTLEAGVPVAMGSDIAGGNTLSMFRVMDCAYKTQQLQDNVLSPLLNFYLSTLGGAHALGMGEKMGNFIPGKMANFLALDLSAVEELKIRIAGNGHSGENGEQTLAALIHLGDERLVKQTYIRGRRVH